jgi:hypothetical protein
VVIYQELNDELVRRVPELADGLAELRQMWEDEDPGPHVVYGDLLVPYLRNAVRADRPPSTFSAAMELLEEMLSNFDDDEMRNVVGASVLEPLSGEREVWSALQESMGLHTRALAEQIASK